MIIEFKRIHNDLREEESIMNASGLIILQILEIILFIAHPNSYIKNSTFGVLNTATNERVVYQLNSLMAFPICLSLILQIVRVLQFSSFNSTKIQRINTLLSKRMLPTFLPLKNLISTYPWSFIASSLAISVCVFSVLVLVFERPLSLLDDGPFISLDIAIWYVVVSMTTIGYGEMTAKTGYGRVLVIILVLWGNLWSAIFLSSLSPYLQLKLYEEKALHLFNRITHRRQLNNLSSDVLSSLYSLKTARRAVFEDNENFIKITNQKLYSLMKRLREVRNELANNDIEGNYFEDRLLFSAEEFSSLSERLSTQMENTIMGLLKIVDTAIRKLDKKKDTISVKEFSWRRNSLFLIKQILSKGNSQFALKIAADTNKVSENSDSDNQEDAFHQDLESLPPGKVNWGDNEDAYDDFLKKVTNR